MIRVMSLLILTAVSLAADVPKFGVGEDGRWSLPLRYWSHWTPFASAGDHAFLATVTKLGPEVPANENQEPPFQYRTGTVKVLEFLHPAQDKVPELARVRELGLEGLEGLVIGDRVVVFVDPEPYEGGFVINYHDGGCLVGIRLPPLDDLELGKDEQELLLKTLREGRVDLQRLTSEELGVWIKVDPAGVARQFQRELDMERLQWKKAAP